MLTASLLHSIIPHGGGLNDVTTCHVRVQYISNACKMLLDLQA